ncbi:class I SAM-dependent methyltransferase [Ramlibacter rhizophilus]|uniref:Class I SAM-dependent methyltransferase n=1 Tax=Ramlibacter rhizophilus TaxID=1781167 RepID=A0A4Z0BCL3_9BURK|nr:class I SAM-dependent methyltransferase [Ramlibacter rhizophilus]
MRWSEQGQEHSALWRSQSGWPAPARVQAADDQTPADSAYRLACEGTALVWRGDFQNARQLLQALARRIDRPARGRHPAAPSSPAEAFHRQRQAQARRSRLLGMLLIELQADGGIALRRAPDWREACAQAWGPPAGEPVLVSLRDLLGAVGAYEWRRKGVEVPALGTGEAARIHPHYGVFSPVRGEYLDLVAKAALPRDRSLAWDVGTGTGVVAALLARRGIERVVATDLNPRALDCARDNLQRLGLADRVDVVPADLFPPPADARAPLVVCNPPWLPAKPVSALDEAVYDPDSRMLRGFLAGLCERLTPQGEGWLILSDLAEHLGLRSRDELLAWIDQGGLRVQDRLDVRPRHPKASDAQDALAFARAREVTSLWRLVPRHSV